MAYTAYHGRYAQHHTAPPGALRELQATYSGPIKLHLASENMLDNLFEERLEKNDLLPLGESGDHLLVETSYFNPPM